jgi:hypothetical protein
MPDENDKAEASLEELVAAELDKEAQADTGTPAEPAEGADKGGQDRDEHGRFKAKEADKAESKAEAEKEPAAAAAEQTPPAEGEAKSKAEAAAPAGAPPTSWSAPAKAAWDGLPAEVKDAIAKREGEMAAGSAQYRDYADLKPYADMAQRSGTTLAKAMEAYTGIEFLLQQDPARGFAQIAQNIRLSQADAAKIFAHLAQQMGHQFGTATPQPGGGTTQAGQGAGNGVDPQLATVFEPLLKQHLAPYVEKITGLETTLKQQQDANQTASLQRAQSVTAAFAADPQNRYYANLENDIAALLGHGLVVNGVMVRVQKTGDFARDLKAAYDQACKLNPEVSGLLVKQQREKDEAERRAREKEAAEKAKAASRSVTGSRLPGTTVQEAQKGDAKGDLEAQLMAKFS